MCFFGRYTLAYNFIDYNFRTILLQKIKQCSERGISIYLLLYHSNRVLMDTSALSYQEQGWICHNTVQLAQNHLDDWHVQEVPSQQIIPFIFCLWIGFTALFSGFRIWLVQLCCIYHTIKKLYCRCMNVISCRVWSILSSRIIAFFHFPKL